MKKLKGVSAIQENKIRFDGLIFEMKFFGTKFPVNQFGKPNFSKIARSVGCSRETLRKGSLSHLLSMAIAEIGCELKGTRRLNPDPNSAYTKKIEIASIKSKNTQIRKLQHDIRALREELTNTSASTTEEQLRFKRMLNEGERFRL